LQQIKEISCLNDLGRERGSHWGEGEKECEYVCVRERERERERENIQKPLKGSQVAAKSN